MMEELGWQLGFGFEVQLAWDAWGRCTQVYIVVWEECGRIKI
jgi:hypothetical protein